MAAEDNSDIVEMSNETLMEEWTALGAEVTAGRERLLAFSKEHQKRVRQEQVQNLVGAVSEEDKQNLIAAIDAIPVGVESEGEAGGND